MLLCSFDSRIGNQAGLFDLFEMDFDSFSQFFSPKNFMTLQSVFFFFRDLQIDPSEPPHGFINLVSHLFETSPIVEIVTNWLQIYYTFSSRLIMFVNYENSLIKGPYHELINTISPASTEEFTLYSSKNTFTMII